MGICDWANVNEKMKLYHDCEWGVPVYDDTVQFEYLVLELMQSGLSWNTILQKRETLKAAYANFNYEVLADCGPEETDKIIKAQQARGADFESGNLIARAKSLVPILVPLFVSAFRIALDLAMAMEARCYSGGKGRTRMNGMKINGMDLFFMGINILFLGGIIVFRIWRKS